MTTIVGRIRIGNDIKKRYDKLHKLIKVSLF